MGISHGLFYSACPIRVLIRILPAPGEIMPPGPGRKHETYCCI